MELFKQLSSLNCPVKINSSSQLVGESRILLFEWLLRVYDEEFAEQCARESSSRTTRLARQLFVLGLGGTKQAQCEAFVSAGSTANIEESMYVVSELVQMILMARELTTDEALRARFFLVFFSVFFSPPEKFVCKRRERHGFLEEACSKVQCNV